MENDSSNSEQEGPPIVKKETASKDSISQDVFSLIQKISLMDTLPQDTTEALHRGWTDLDTRSRIISLPDSDLVDFFESLIGTFDPQASHEDPADFLLRKREMASEMRASARKASDGTDLRSRFKEGQRLMREDSFRQAFIDFCDAVFGAIVSQTLKQYIDFKVMQIECLFRDNQYAKCANYAMHLMQWMVRFKQNGVIGFHAVKHVEDMSALQIFYGESKVALGEHQRAVDGCSMVVTRFFQIETAVMDRDLFQPRQNLFEKLRVAHDNEDPVFQELGDRSSANIVVDPSGEKGFRGGQFFVKDLVTALTIAKENDTVFLEPGTYAGVSRTSATPDKKVLEFRKSVNIIGAHWSTCTITGSIVKWGEATSVQFSRLTLEIGESDKSDDDIYIMGGEVHFNNCVFESPVNTCMYVISPQNATKETSVFLSHCIIDGLEACRRFITFLGPRPSIYVDSCYVLDMFSFCTVISESMVTAAGITITDSLIVRVQDGLKIVVHHTSTKLRVNIIHSQINLVLYEEDAPSHAFSMTGGSCHVSRNVIFSDHIDAVAFSLHSLISAEIATCLIETSDSNSRALAIGEGIVLSDNSNTSIANVKITGMRIGIRVSNEFEPMNHVILQRCSVSRCSIGLLIKGNAQQRKNIDLAAADCLFETSHNGVMNDCAGSNVDIATSSFRDVPKPILFARANLSAMNLRQNEYVQRIAVSEISDVEAQRQKMYLEFALEENLPHRVAVDDPSSYLLVANEKEELAFVEKYRTIRSPDSH